MSTTNAPHVSGLSDLAKKCIALEELLGREEWDYKIFLDVQRRINDLQVDCPNEDSILDARILWFDRGLKNFRDCVPEILKDPHFHRNWRAPGQFMDLDTIDTFLRRGYLSIFNRRNEFPRLYQEVMDICTRTMRAANKRGMMDVAKEFLNFRAWLQRALLEDRL